MDSSLDFLTNRVDRLAQLESELHTQPVAGCKTKVGTEVEIGFSSDAALFVNDLVDALVRKLCVFCEPVRRDAHRHKELFAEEFPGMKVDVFFHGFSDSQ